MPLPENPPPPSVVDMLEPYVRFLDTWFQFLFPNLQRIAAEGLAEAILVGTTIALTLYVLKYCRDFYRHYRKLDDKTVSFSVNYIEDNTLKLRPVAEEISIEDLFPQLIRQQAFIKAVKRLPKDKTVVMMPLKYESSIMGTLQSYVSKDFGDNFFTVAAGRRMQVEDFILMITYERYEDIPLRKIRVIFTHRQLLNRLPAYENTYLRYEKPHQRKRLLTMAEIHETYYGLAPERYINYHIELPLECPEDEPSATP